MRKTLQSILDVPVNTFVPESRNVVIVLLKENNEVIVQDRD